MKHKNSISFSTIEDLRNLIDKNGALPNYISRDHVCQDLSTFLDSETDIYDCNNDSASTKISKVS